VQGFFSYIQFAGVLIPAKIAAKIEDIKYIRNQTSVYWIKGYVSETNGAARIKFPD
jgi:hypothetical protein